MGAGQGCNVIRKEDKDMNKKVWCPIIIAGMILSLSITAFAQEEKVWNDERIGIKIDTLERTDSYPNELRRPGYRYKSPDNGEDYFVIKITITYIRNIHLGMPSQDDKLFLFDIKGKEYEMLNVQYKGVDFKAGLTGEEYEIVEGATGIMLFKIPENIEPAKLMFAYPYWESWEEKNIKHGNIEIDLLKHY